MNEDVKVVEELIDLYNKKGFNHTGSINLVEPNTLYFTKNSNIINEKIRNVKSRIRSTPNVHVVIPKYCEHLVKYDEFKHITFYPADNVQFVFGEVHNYVHGFMAFYTQPNVSKQSFVDPTASIDTEGIHLYHTPYGHKRQLKHLSNVKILKGCSIGAYTVIHKGVFEPTIIGEYVTIGSLVNIGHNCNIGDHTVITPGTVIAGSCNIGKNCWIGCNTTIKHFTNICDNVVIGQGSNVRHNINKSGIYAGEPLKRIGPYTDNWNF